MAKIGYLDDYRMRITTYASSPLDSMIKTHEHLVNDSFSLSPSYRMGAMNGNPIDFLLVSGNNSKNMYGEKEFIFRPSTVIERGDVIALDSDSWIIIDRNYENIISPKATTYLCTDNLKWKDSSGNIHSYPCATVPYRTIRNIQQDPFTLNVAEGHMFLMVQMNADTTSVVLKQRFILGNQVYEVTGIDDSNYVYNGKGLIYFTVGVTTKNGFNDDIVNRIADNTSIYADLTPPPSSISTTSDNTTPPPTGGNKLW